MFPFLLAEGENFGWPGALAFTALCAMVVAIVWIKSRSK